MIKLEITKLAEIIALRKAILMLKYNHDKRDIANFLGSNILYDVLQEFESVIEKYSVAKDGYPLNKPDDISLVKEYIRYYEGWFEVSDKIKLVRMIAYPLIIEDILCKELIDYGNENNIMKQE